MKDLNNTNNHSDPMISIKHSTQQTQNTFFSNKQRIFTKIDHLMSHKANLNSVKKTESL